MEHPGFFDRAGPFPLAHIVHTLGLEPLKGGTSERVIEDVRPLDRAMGSHISFLDNKSYLPQLAATAAAACFIAPSLAERVPEGTAALATREPYRAYARTLQMFYPAAMRPRTAEFGGGDGSGLVHPSARIEEGARIEPGAVIGREAQIGRGTVIAAGAVVGYRVSIGRDSFLGPNASLTHALVGDRVIIHAGAKIGQDGFGFAMGPKGHLKVPQIGRVIIQDDVEIGANSTIDRGALKDTVIGEGTKIDNLVQIGHNVQIGRHCVVVGMVGISGSATLGDFVVVGGQAGIVGHINIGSGAQIAGGSGVSENVPPGERWGGTPAKPFKSWAREVAALRRLSARRKGND